MPKDTYTERDYFQFKSCKLANKQAAFKINVDGVLLAAWVSVQENSRILDIGTGTGVIAILLAKQNSTALFDLIDPHPGSFREAEFNVRLNKLTHRCNVHQSDLQHFEPPIRYDHIISNPPFFESGTLPFSNSRQSARHTTTLNYEDLWKQISRLTHETSRVSLIYPSESDIKMREMAQYFNFYNYKQCRVRGHENGAVIRCMTEFRFLEAQSGPVLPTEEISIRSEDKVSYSTAYKEITAAFYLNF